MRARSFKSKPLIADPNADVFATDDGEELDNAEVGGLTKATFVIGGESKKKREVASRSRLGSGAASAESILAKATDADDDLLPLLPLPGSKIDESLSDEEEDDLLSLVEADVDTVVVSDDEEDGDEGEEEVAPAPKRARKKAEPKPDFSLVAETTYRFPHSKTMLDIIPDIRGTFSIRMAYQRGKNSIPVFQSTPLRAVAEIRCRGQHFPVSLLQHTRKKRDRITLGARRKTATSWRAAVRCGVVVTGRHDHFTWFWRVTATAPALNMPVAAEAKDRSPEAVRIALPFTPGKVKMLSMPGAEGRGLVVMLNDMAVSVVAQTHGGRTPVIEADESGLYLALENAELGGEGTALAWETWFAPAKSEPEAIALLARHLASAADKQQIPPEKSETFLTRLAEYSERELMRFDTIEKRGMDKLIYRVGPHRADMLLIGPGADTALTAQSLLNRFLANGDDALKMRVRFLTNGLCEFQNSREDSAHWGAMFDALVRKTEWGDQYGKKTISFTTTARIAKGLQVLQSHFGVELYERTALAAAQWLLLKLDENGQPQGERFAWDGKVIKSASPWLAGEALLPLCETFRATRNEVYLKTALRTMGTIRARVKEFTMTFETASTENLAALVEGVLLISREYEQPELVAFARQIGQAIRSRRLPDGSVSDPTGVSESVQEDLPLLTTTLAAARAALSLTRVDSDPLWVTFALRAARAVVGMLKGYRGYINAADQGSILALSQNILLAIAARAQGSVADYDKLTLHREWQTFAPDPATREYIKVILPNGDSADYLALVSPVSQQVIIAVYAPAGTEAVEITKNGKTPYLTNLLSGEYEQRAALQNLEATGTEGCIGVFLADT